MDMRNENIPVEAAQDPGTSGKRRIAIVAVVAALALAGIVLWWWGGRGYESTDDAFIQADIVTIAPKISGTVKAVAVVENQAVKAGDLLVELDPADYDVKVQQARAGLAAAQADLALTRERAAAGIGQAEAGTRSTIAESERAQADVERFRQLYAKDEISKQQLDMAEAQARSLKARADEAHSRLRDAQSAPRQVAVKESIVATRQAELQQAELALSYTRITAPRDGKVTRKNVQPGGQVAPGMALLAIVGDEPWVVANFKETQLARIRPGAPATFEVDAYPGYTFKGRVDSVQSGTGAVFSLLPPENATGNFVKVVQRVPVKLVFDPKPDEQHRLVPGMSVEPTIDVTAEPVASRMADAPR
jgi:membrane fusion protein, multidrug efflux system